MLGGHAHAGHSVVLGVVVGTGDHIDAQPDELVDKWRIDALVGSVRFRFRPPFVVVEQSVLAVVVRENVGAIR